MIRQRGWPQAFQISHLSTALQVLQVLLPLESVIPQNHSPVHLTVLGIYTDSDKGFKMSDQINYVCKVTFLELRCMSSIHHHLVTEPQRNLSLPTSFRSRPSSVHDQRTSACSEVCSKMNPEHLYLSSGYLHPFLIC